MEQQQAHDNHRDCKGRHEQGLAVQLLGVLDGAVFLECELEIDSHHKSDQRESEDQLDAVTHDEGPKEEHRRRSIKEDGDQKRLWCVVLEGSAVGCGNAAVLEFG